MRTKSDRCVSRTGESDVENTIDPNDDVDAICRYKKGAVIIHQLDIDADDTAVGCRDSLSNYIPSGRFSCHFQQAMI